jgi:hypothetical protein
MWLARQKYQAALEGPLRQLFALNPTRLGHPARPAAGRMGLERRPPDARRRMVAPGQLDVPAREHLAPGLQHAGAVAGRRLTERIFGSTRFVGLYFLAGVSGSLASVLWNPHVNSVGASGAIFGVIGGLLAFLGRPNSGVPPTVVSELRSSLLPFLLFSLWMGFVYPHTDNAAHIGGLVGGWLAGHLLARSIHLPEHRQG